MVKVSVIMPNKNNERWLRKSIESVINQTYKNWELIIVDDHSTDKSREIIREYMDRDDRVTGIFDPNVTYPQTKNLGIEISSGRYLLFLDSDDGIDERMLEDGVRHLQKYKVDAYVSSYRVIRSNGNKVEFRYKSGIYPKEDGLRLRYRFGNGNTLLKRSIIDKYGIKFLEYKYSEDSYFFYLYLSVSGDVYVSDLIGFVNNRMGSTVVSTGNFQEKFAQTMKNYELLFARLEELGKDDAVRLIRKYPLPRSVVTYLDVTPRKYKLRYLLKYSRIIVPYLLLKRCNKHECPWVYATVLDSIVPVKWLLRAFG